MYRVCLLFLSLLLLLTIIACPSSENHVIAKAVQKSVLPAFPDSAWWASSGIQLRPLERNYEQAKSRVNQERKALNTAFQKGNIPLDSVRKSFTQNLLNRIIPHWYGTSWSFSGYSAIPREGSIACGYFISTTLQDAGVHLDRYRLAQQSPSGEASILSMGDTVRVLRHAVSDSVIATLKVRLPEGLYFAGLGGSHVGYLLKWHGELLLLHSNYTTPAEVMIQPLAQSVFTGYSKFYISDITYNNSLIISWLKGSEVPTRNVAEAIFVNW